MKTTTVSFHGLRITSTVPLYQFDYGQMLLFSDLDLPEAYEVHFSNSDKRGESTQQIGDASGVTIPDMYFQSGEDIFAWIYLHADDDDGETEYKVKIPIKKRARPTEETPTPVQQSAITQALAALEAAVATCLGIEISFADANSDGNITITKGATS